jgi:ribonuclease HI
MSAFGRSTSRDGAALPKHGVEDLAQFRARLTQLRRELTPPINADVYQAYTDGACLANPNGPGGWAAVVATHGGASNAWELWGHLSSTSNNRAEVLGVLAALEWVPPGSTIVVRSDSQYTVNVLAGTYKAKANVDLWTELRRVAAEKGLTVRPEWVRGHVGDPGNERADRLAVLGAVQGDVERAAQLRAEEDSSADERRVRRAPSLPSELAGLEPRGPWESGFVQSVAKQLRAGRSLSEKQQAVIDRIRRRGTADGGTATAA